MKKTTILIVKKSLLKPVLCAIAFASVALFLPCFAFAQNTFSVASGTWSNAANWSAGHAPNGTENLVIPSGSNCTLDVNYTGNGTYTLTISGILQVPSATLSTPNAIVLMNANDATLSGGGTVTLGTLTVNTPNATDQVSIFNSTAAAPISIGIGNANGTLNLTNGYLELLGQVLGFTKYATINVTGTGNFANSADGISGDADANGGTVDFLGSSGANVNINDAPTFYNLTVPTGNLQLNFGSTGNARINGIFSVPTDGNQFNAAGNPLIWGPNSTLSFYANGQWHPNQYLNTLWSAIGSSTIGVTPGYPNNVTLLNVPANTAIADNQNINGTLTLGDGTSGNKVNGFVLGTDFTCASLITTANSILDNVTNLTLDGTAPCNIPDTLSVSSATVITNLALTNATNVILNSPVTVSGTFTLTSGTLLTSSANILNITNTATNAITGAGIGSGSSIDGPVKWNVVGAGTYLFPLSSGTDSPCPSVYLPLTLAASGTATVTAQAIAQSGSGGTVDATLSSLSNTEYWSFSTTSSLAGSTISLARPTAIAPLALIAESNTANGTYTSIGGTAAVDGVNNSNDIGSGTSLFFTLGVPPIVSTLAATSITTSGATLNGAFNTQGTSLTTSFNYGPTTSYGTTTASAHSPINSNLAVADSLVLTGLTANTLYHYQATDGVNSGSDVVFITAPNPPTVGTPTAPGNDGFTANWTAPAVTGTAPYTYNVEVSTDPTFATGDSIIYNISSASTSDVLTGFASATTYYYRVQTANATAVSTWSAASTGISTNIFPTPPCTTGTGSTTSTGSITKALSLPVIDGQVDPVWAGVPANNISFVSVNAPGTGNTQTWKAMWSTDSLYFLIQVNDPTLISQAAGLVGTSATIPTGATQSTCTAQPYYGSDGVEIALAPDGILTGGYNGYNDVQFRFNLGSSVVSGQSSGTANQFTGAIFNSVYQKIDFQIVTTSTGYTVEAAIPLYPGIDSLQAGGYFAATAGQNIGLEVQVNDATSAGGCRAAQYSWFNGSPNPYQNPSTFAEATYTTCPVPPTVILPTVTNITATSAVLGATVVSSGDAALTSRGTGYTASPDTSGLSNPLAEGGTGISVYSGPIRTGLAPQTKYYYLGYANNANNETGVSTVDSFFTLSALPTSQPILSTAACSSSLTLNWTAIQFPAADSATNTGYIILRRQDGTNPTATGISTRVALTQGTLPPGTTLVATIPSGSTLTYTDVSAVTGTTYNYLLVPFTWDGNAADSTYNYDTTGAHSIIASIGTGSPAPTVVATQPTCTVPQGSIVVTTPATGVSYSFDNGNTFQAIDSISSLVPTTDTTYEVSVKDNNSGCVSKDTAVVISAVPSAPTAPTASATEQPTCTTPTGTITVSAPESGVTYSFDNGTTFGSSNSSSGLVPGTYQIVVKNTAGCVSSATQVIITPVPTANFTVSAGDDTTIISGGTATLIGSVDPAGSYTYLWTNASEVPISNADSLVAQSLPTATASYTLKATDGNGCFASGSVTVTVNAATCNPTVPNAFTPGHSPYQYWIISKGDCITKVGVDVYNRWGGLVYHSDDYQNDWDGTYKGKAIPDATYYYVVNIYYSSTRIETVTGNVTIIR